MPKGSQWRRVIFACAIGTLVAGVTAAVSASSEAPNNALVAPLADVLGEPTAALGPWGDFVAPADADLVVTQPDGTEFRARLTPAEVGGELEVDGYSILQDADGWWHYAVSRQADGLVASAAAVGLDAVPAGIVQGVGRIANVWLDDSGLDARSQVLRQLQIASRLAQEQARAAGEPRIFRFPVLMLATWWDGEAGQSGPQFQSGSDTAEHFTALLDGFGGNPRGTLTEFYFENSQGQFLVEVDVFGPYQSIRSIEDPCYYGGIDPPDDPIDDLDPADTVLGVGGLGVAGMALEAVPQADLDVDFTSYDNDGDGYVDFMGIIHSGADMAVTGDECNTWSHALPISAFGGIVEGLVGLPPGTLHLGLPTSDGVLVDRLFTMPEFDQAGSQLAIGVATHEMAHALGEPDYYGVSGTSSGTGDWDIMSGGSYLGNPDGTNPSWFNPASRVFQGWHTPTIVHDDMRDVTLQARSSPLPGYTAGTPNPNLLLVPTKWIHVGDTDELGHTWTDLDVFGLVLDGDLGYVIEGYYLEFASRMPQAAPLVAPMTRSPYFDRALHGSGLMTWHFDYWRRSNVYFGDNNGQDDANRLQMDVEEWDENDNTQEIQLNEHRGEASDLAHDAATGITSGGHLANPAVPDVVGDPQGGVAFDGVVVPTQTSDFTFVVDDNPANYTMTVRAGSSGDCTLQLLHEGVAVSESVDSGGPGAQEEIAVTLPEPGNWTARVGDFLGCLSFTGTVDFSAPTGFDSKGTADTWSNWTGAPTGWAFTNIRTGGGEGLDFSADAGGPTQLVLDVIHLGADEADVSPGFAKPVENAVHGRSGANVGRENAFAVPVFSNGGTAPGSVHVVVREGSPTGTVVGEGDVELGAYERRDFTFSYTPDEEGSYDLYTSVDPADAVDEEHEGNNVQKATGWAGPANPVVLIVDDDGPIESEEMYAGALAALGIPYAIVGRHVDAATMATYEAVIWTSAIDRGPGQLDEADRAEIATYLDGGGELWLSSNRAIGALTVEGEDEAAFGAAYFGVISEETDTFIKPVIAHGLGDIFGTASYAFEPYPIRPFVDQLEVSEGALGTVTPLFEVLESGRPNTDGALLGVRLEAPAESGAFRTVTNTFNLVQVSDPASAIAITRSVMDHFGVTGGRYAVDTAEPVIYHAGNRFQVSGRALPVRAIVLGGEAGAPVLLFYRAHSANGVWNAMPMELQSEAGAYLATLPEAAVTPQGVDYYLRAGTGSTFDPRAAANGSAVAHAVAVAVPEVAGAPLTPSVPPVLPPILPSLPATGGDAPLALFAGLVAFAVVLRLLGDRRRSAA